MAAISTKLILNVVAGGSFGLGVVTVLASLVAFNGESFYHNDTLGIQFGMSIDAADQIIKVWMRAPSALYVVSTIKNVVSISEEGERTPAGLAELFPVGGPTYGAGTVQFEIFSADEEQMPDLVNRDQSVVPMAFIRTASKFPSVLRWMMIMGGMAINNWGIVKLMILAAAFGMIVLGGGLLALYFKSKNNQVIEIKNEVRSIPNE